MDIPVSDAKGQLTDLVHRAEAGEDVVLTRHGQPVARLVPVCPKPSATARRAAIEQARAAGRAAATNGPSAERSQDFLYDEAGLPARSARAGAGRIRKASAPAKP